MGWTTDLVLMTRVLANDYAAPQKYDDTYLQRLLVCAGVLVKKELELPYDYAFDIANVTITPDPITVGDAVLQALLPLKAACIINTNQYVAAIGQGIRVRDGDSAIDTSVSFGGYRDILRLGPCETYRLLKWQLQAAAASVMGGAVAGLYRAPGDDQLDTVSFFYDQFANGLARCNRSGARVGTWTN